MRPPRRQARTLPSGPSVRVRARGSGCSRAVSGPRRSGLTLGVTVGAIVVVNAAGDVVDTSTGLPWLAYQIAEFGLTPPPADQIAAYAARRHRVQPAQHHDRGRRHRRRVEPGRRVVASPSPPTGRIGPRPSGRVIPHWMAIRCSRWPPAPSRCRRTATTPASMSPETPADLGCRFGCGGLSGPRGPGRRTRRGVGRRNTVLPRHVAGSVPVNDGSELCW